MKMLIVYLLLISIILPSSELSIQNIYLRRISDAFIKMASSYETNECKNNTQCLKTQYCLTEVCRNPCPGSCGIDASCHVINHTLSCICPDCYEGDAYEQCTPLQNLQHIKCQFNRLINYLGGT
ncbi:hypothetical protein PV328_005790 [Microctonus aethiopoides]|uniref:Uncharacterized protein n=1 Tax=Microctonus aethiopoides TaxID=144406 RepID=A0AA39KSN7_9HYME|nr:hypothetical protein PV328_005790 [Microctonus aethiopoides]